MKWKLLATIVRADGTTFSQNVKYLSEEESSDQDLIHRLLSEYKKQLGDDYFIVDYYVGW